MDDFERDPEAQKIFEQRERERRQNEKSKIARHKLDAREAEIRQSWIEKFFTVSVNPAFFDQTDYGLNGVAERAAPWAGPVQLYAATALQTIQVENNMLRCCLKDFIAALNAGRAAGKRQWSDDYLAKWEGRILKLLRQTLAESEQRLDQCFKVSRALKEFQSVPIKREKANLVLISIYRNKIPKEDEYTIRADGLKMDRRCPFSQLWEFDWQIDWEKVGKRE